MTVEQIVGEAARRAITTTAGLAIAAVERPTRRERDRPVDRVAGTIGRLVGADGTQSVLTVPVVVAGAPLSHAVRSPADPLRVELRIGDDVRFACPGPAGRPRRGGTPEG